MSYRLATVSHLTLGSNWNSVYSKLQLFFSLDWPKAPTGSPLTDSASKAWKTKFTTVLYWSITSWIGYMLTGRFLATAISCVSTIPVFQLSCHNAKVQQAITLHIFIYFHYKYSTLETQNSEIVYTSSLLCTNMKQRYHCIAQGVCDTDVDSKWRTADRRDMFLTRTKMINISSLTLNWLLRHKHQSLCSAIHHENNPPLTNHPFTTRGSSQYNDYCSYRLCVSWANFAA